MLMSCLSVNVYLVGAVSCLVPMYQSECSPKSLRGAIVGLYQLAITIGALLAAIVLNATKDEQSHTSWRVSAPLTPYLRSSVRSAVVHHAGYRYRLPLPSNSHGPLSSLEACCTCLNRPDICFTKDARKPLAKLFLGLYSTAPIPPKLMQSVLRSRS